MTPAQIISAAKDLAILLALGFILWYVHRADENAAALRDLKADTKQLVANQATTDRWHQEQTDANTKSNDSLAGLVSAIKAERASPPVPAPIIVRIPASQAANLPAAPAAAAGGRTDSGGTSPGGGAALQPSDERALLASFDAFELKYGKALIDCHRVIDSWPH